MIFNFVRPIRFGRFGRSRGSVSHFGYAAPSGGGSNESTPSAFTFDLPLTDLGAGAVDTTPVFALGVGTPTFTRATAAWTKLSTGLWASVASGTARYSYLGLSDSAVGAAGGYLFETAATNVLTYSNDFTNAAWAKVTMTTAMTSVGPDGAANSATRLTASGALSTVLQASAGGASSRTWSVWVRRVTGTGTIKLFQGATITADLASSLNTSTYVKLEQNASVDVSVLGVGIQIGTSTDAIDVWCGGFEANAIATSPIPTTTVAVTRNADVLEYASAGNLVGATGSAYGEIYYYGDPDVALFSIPGSCQALRGFSAKNYMIDGTNLVNTANSSSINTVTKVAGSWGATGMSSVMSGGTVATGLFDGVMGTGAGNIQIGRNESGGQSVAIMRNLKLYGSQLSDATIQTLTT